jgi:hypothetical protein
MAIPAGSTHQHVPRPWHGQPQRIITPHACGEHVGSMMSVLELRPGGHDIALWQRSAHRRAWRTGRCRQRPKAAVRVGAAMNTRVAPSRGCRWTGEEPAKQ